MGSAANPSSNPPNPNPNPWAPYDRFKDCSQVTCSIYCPQFCYSILPPPPADDGSGSPFSPLIIAIIGVLASGLLLVSYYIILARYCKRRNGRSTGVEPEGSHEDEGQDQWQVAPNGLDESLIKTIKVCKYQKSGSFIEGSDCAVCLSEFQENESLRLLPKCSHAFHLPCIDTWLKSHSNCPLCRANVVVSAAAPPEQSSSLSMNAFEAHRPSDVTVVMMDGPETCEHVIVNLGNGDPEMIDQESAAEQLRRSVSRGPFPRQPHLLISDILKAEDTDEDLGPRNAEPWRNSGPSKGESPSSFVDEKRAVYGGTFTLTVHGKGKNSAVCH